MESGVVARLAGDESFAAELKARNDRAAAEAELRPKPAQPAARPVATVPAVARAEDDDETGNSDWDEGAPEWPDETAEASMMGEVNGQPDAPVPEATTRKRTRLRDAEGDGPLPDLDAMIAAIPANVRDTLEELFRAQFTMVRRIPPGVFKQQPADDAN